MFWLLLCWLEICSYLKKEGKQYHQIMMIFPIWLLSNAKMDVTCLEIIFYLGKKSYPMVHFVFNVKKKDEGIGLSSLLNVSKIQKLPIQRMKFIRNGEIIIGNDGIPEFKKKT